MRRELIVRVYADQSRAVDLNAFMNKLEEAVEACWDAHNKGLMMSTTLPDSPDSAGEKHG